MYKAALRYKNESSFEVSLAFIPLTHAPPTLQKAFTSHLLIFLKAAQRDLQSHLYTECGKSASISLEVTMNTIKHNLYQAISWC